MAVPLLCWSLHAVPQGPQNPTGGEEAFEKVDPYTRGEREALDRAGYVSLGPFEWIEGARTEDVRETLGGIDVLWIETAHFKIGSTLRSYKPQGDPREDDKLEAELGRLKKKLERYRAPRNKIDPWLRLHLYAQRLEDVYASFCEWFGIEDGDFPDGRKTAAEGVFMGRGPYLGMERKFTVLLLEKTSGLGRFLRKYAERDAEAWDRLHLNGTMFLGVSAEGVSALGYELDAALHCAVAAETTHILLGGFRQSWHMTPTWLEFGLAHVASKRVDERFVPAAGSVAGGHDEESWKWEPRVRGLVENKVAKPWLDSVGWRKWEDLKGQGHLMVWSRVSWLLSSRKPAELKSFLLAITDPLPADLLDAPEEDKAKFLRERQITAAQSAFGKGFEELEADWRKYVQKKYPKK